MNGIAVLDFIAFVCAGSALLLCLLRLRKKIPAAAYSALCVYLFITVFYNFSNLLEWLAITDALDAYEDHLMILGPMLWIFMLFAFTESMLSSTIRKNEENFKSLSVHDSLTGFFNRFYYETQMNLMNKDLSRYRPLSIMCIDVDGLKLINDTLGHQSGDFLLKETAAIIARVFRKVDMITRVGGDEFCVLLPGTPFEAVNDKRSRLYQLVEEYNLRNPEICISVSIGVSTAAHEEDRDVFEVFRRADDNMYEHKLIQKKSRKSKIVDFLLSALSYRDFVVQGHAERLAYLSGVLADRMDLPVEQKANLILLARLHDVGKIGVPEQVLMKKGPLSSKEHQIIKNHPEIGRNFALRSKELTHISEFIYHHHEAWDGSGYPAGLKGRQIPQECRILAIVDAYDAMTNERPYRKALSHEEAVKELSRLRGVQFDPEILTIFLEVVERERSRNIPAHDTDPGR
ncbi:MAG: diguanylate cyclase [Candidatus Omnitrophica bacterium]|nr:diguanylate cyclase [Candidatus Omnitrophota bacterium]